MTAVPLLLLLLAAACGAQYLPIPSVYPGSALGNPKFASRLLFDFARPPRLSRSSLPKLAPLYRRCCDYHCLVLSLAHAHPRLRGQSHG